MSKSPSRSRSPSPSRKRVLVTGGSGLLGRALLRNLRSAGFQVLGLAWSRSGPELRKVDIRDPKALAAVLDEFKPSVVIHAAAQRAPDQFEKAAEESNRLNVEVPKQLAELCIARKIRMILISTDYVFDGKSAPYAESDPVSPINAYGKSKVDAERVVTELFSSSGIAPIILRIPVLYGSDEEYIGESAVSSLLKALLDRSGAEKLVSSYELRRPACTEDIAAILTKLVNITIKDTTGKKVHGIYQWSGSEEMSKYKMVQVMAEVLGLPVDHIKEDPSPGTGAPRPRDVSMRRTRLEQLGIDYHTKFAEGVKYFRKFLPEH